MDGVQLPLPLQLPSEPDLDDFLPGPNAEALASVRACADDGPERYIYLFGERGTGKTHLLMAACRAVGARGRHGRFLGLSGDGLEQAGLADAAEGFDLVCLDDIHAAAGNDALEEALFDLYNRLRDSDRRLIVAGDRPVGQLPLRLPDLRSRLAWGPGYRLRPLDDATRIALIQRAAARRGMQLGPATARYILYRCPRDPHSLDSLLERLDRATLAARRHPTIPLVRDLLEGSAD